MSITGDLFRVTVKGSRESIVKMLNAALKSFKSDNVIAESDDVETMNSKLELFTGRNGNDLGIPDLLLAQDNNADANRYLELVRVEDDAPGLMIAKFSYYLGETALYDDDKSVGWDTVVQQYSCQVFVDDDLYSNGQFIRFGSATIYDASDSDGELRRLHLESGSIYDAQEYPIFLRTLVYLYPDHYGVDWEHYHSKHPEVEFSQDECLAWFKKQKQPWQQVETEDTEGVETVSLSHLINENGHAVIPGSIKTIYYGAFYNCTSLTSVDIQEGVEEIQECSFKGCTALTHVTLPKSLKSVSFDAFEGCPCEEVVMKECESRSIII